MAKSRHLKAVPLSAESQNRIELTQQNIYNFVLKKFEPCGGVEPLSDTAFIFELKNKAIFRDMLKLDKHERSLIFAYIDRLDVLTFDGRNALKQAFEAFEQSERSQGNPDVPASKKSAEYDFYVAMFKALYPKASRCEFSRKMLYWDEVQNRWSPIANNLSIAKSFCHDDPEFAASRVDDHFETWQSSTPPQLLINIPEWDKYDRIEEIVSRLKIGNMTHVDAYELILDWGAKMWLRIQNPWVRNRILIFQSLTQNIGKDWLIDALVGGLTAPGLGYVQSTHIDDSGEMGQKLHRAICFKLSEFRTDKASVNQLKWVIDSPESGERLKYDKEAEPRACRASFIASANPDDLLRDFTGASRFIIISLIGAPGEAIKYNPGYPGARGFEDFENHRLQIIAQYKHFAEKGFTASGETEEMLSQTLKRGTPVDPIVDLLEYFDNWCSKFAANLPNHDSSHWVANVDIDDFFLEAGKQFKWSIFVIRNHLTRAGRGRVVKNKRGYNYKPQSLLSYAEGDD